VVTSAVAAPSTTRAPSPYSEYVSLWNAHNDDSDLEMQAVVEASLDDNRYSCLFLCDVTV